LRFAFIATVQVGSSSRQQLPEGTGEQSLTRWTSPM
jgi:hypothetical protein